MSDVKPALRCAAVAAFGIVLGCRINSRLAPPDRIQTARVKRYEAKVAQWFRGRGRFVTSGTHAVVRPVERDGDAFI
jgi:hypothetical protein